MKALLKRIEGGLKYGLAFLPMAVALGGTATFIWLAAHGANVLNSTREFVKSSPEYQEMLESDEAVLKSQLDNKLITSQEYVEKKKDLGSQDYILSYLEIDSEENKELIDKLKKGDDMQFAGISCSILFPVISAGGIFLYTISDLFQSARAWARDDIITASEIKQEKKRMKEYAEYKEELN